MKRGFCHINKNTGMQLRKKNGIIMKKTVSNLKHKEHWNANIREEEEEEGGTLRKEYDEMMTANTNKTDVLNQDYGRERESK